MQRFPIVLTLACAASAAAAADVYKWTDATGVVHYADTEPAAGANAELMHLNGSSAKAAAASAENPAGAAEHTGAAQGTQVTTGPDAGKLCTQARSSLELLQSRTPVGLDTNGNGKPEPLDDNARQVQIARAQTLIARYCK